MTVQRMAPLHWRVYTAGTEKPVENIIRDPPPPPPPPPLSLRLLLQTKNGLKFIANVFLIVDEIKRFGTETADNGDNPNRDNKDCLIPTSLSNGYTTKPLRSVRRVLEEPLIIVTDHQKDNPKSDYFTGLLIRKIFSTQECPLAKVLGLYVHSFPFSLESNRS